MSDPRRRLLPLLLLVPLALLLLAVSCSDNEEEVSEQRTASPAQTATQAVQTSQPAASCPSPTGTAPEPDMTKNYTQAPAMSIDPAKKYTATVKTVRGDFTIDLRPDIAPQHVNSFVFLARDHFYDGVIFHRVVAGFVAQAGDPTGTGSGGPGYALPLEPSDVPFERGVVGMARTNDPNSAGSQWFVTFGSASHLNGQYTVFGAVTQGMDVVDCIAKGDAITAIEVTEQ